MPTKQTTGPKRNIPAIAVAICLILYLWYTMPKTVEQLYPYLDLSECTGVTIWYMDDNSVGVSEIRTLSAEEAAPFVDLFEGRTFRRTLGSIFPSNGEVHRTQPGDFFWSVLFLFDDVTLPDGSIADRALLQVDNHWGKVSISSNNKAVHKLSTAGKDAWLQEVMDAIYATQTP